MATDDQSGSSNTTQRVGRMTELAAILSVAVATANSVVAFAFESIGHLVLFFSILIGVIGGLYLLAE